MSPPPTILADLLALYEQGLYLRACTRAQEFGPLHTWQGTQALLLAGRLAANLGAPRLASGLHLRAWRRDRRDPEATYYAARVVMDRRGPLAAWEFLERHPAPPESEPRVRAEWFALRANVASQLRDFEAAEEWLSRADALAPDLPWLAVERAAVREHEDRYPEALAAARRSLELHPWYRPGVQVTVHLLQLQGEDDEALALLQEAAERLESGALWAQLASLYSEREQPREALAATERYPALTPLMEPAVEGWLAARRSDLACALGDLPQAVALARASGSPFHEEVANRLERQLRGEEEPGRRVLLPVGFVRQHHLTCGPATLAALSRFWSMPADHLEVAEAICYDGTSDHSERRWADERGWLAREFTVTWDAARALLDRGIPFTLTTVEPGSAHLQAAIGYDGRRGTLLVRDPYERHHGEFLAQGMLDRYRSTGPRGMVMVPRALADRLDGIELLDAALYDHHYRLQRALAEHRRDAAAEAYAALQAEAPEHRLTLQARRALAVYDANPVDLLACAEALLERYPEDANLELMRLGCLRDLARREERLERLAAICADPGAPPLFLQQYARELAPDARERETAARLLRRALRINPTDARSLHALAELRRDARDFAGALPRFRFAACLEITNEGWAQSYFSASRFLGETGTALRFLRDRFERFGKRSGAPARTLCWAYGQLDHSEEAFQVLEAALALRPEDGELMLFAAQAHLGHGDLDRAAACLAAAEPRSSRGAWRRAAAELAALRGDSADSLRLLQAVAAEEPLDVDLQRAVAARLAELEGPEAALAYLQDLVARFPHNWPFHRLCIERLREGDSAALEAALRDLLAVNPADAWAHRELALALADQGRPGEAEAAAAEAGRLDPEHSALYCLHGQLLARAGRVAEAREAYRRAITLSVDTEYALWALVDLSVTPAERRAALAFIESELVEQVVFGDGLLLYRSLARNTLDAEELLASLRAALAARPDLWHAWSAVVRQLLDMDRLDEALAEARRATERFPLLPVLWLDLAAVHQARADREAEIEALNQALRLQPGWGAAVRQLASAHERAGRLPEARAVLEAAVRRQPFEAQHHGRLAQLLWQSGERGLALQHLERAVALEPGYEWAWGALRDRELESLAPGEPPARAAAAARDLVRRRPGEAHAWLTLARMLPDAELEERLRALDRAVALSPLLTEAYDLKAVLLAGDAHGVGPGRFEEALAACAAPAWGGQLPVELRGRAAWVEAARGDFPAALAGMRALLEEDPNYFWGWTQVARWSEASGATADFVAAAQALTRLSPQDSWAWGTLGNACARAGDRAGARAAFQRAFDLSPGYLFAGLSLLDAQLADDDLEGAAATHLALQLQAPTDPWVMAREVVLAARRGQEEAAAAALRRLWRVDADRWPLDHAVTAMLEAGWAAEIDRLLREALDVEGVNPHVGALWVERCAAQKDAACERRLPELLARGELGVLATVAYLTHFAGVGGPHPVRAYIRRQREPLRRDTRTWASGGATLAQIGDYPEAAEWMADWAGRAGVEPWMLLNLALARHSIGEHAEATAAHRAALELPADETHLAHSLWVAMEEALAGDAGEAFRLVGVDRDALDPFYRYLVALIDTVLAARQEDGDDPSAFNRARDCLARADAIFSPFSLRGSPALRRAYHRAVRRVARKHSTLPARLWSLYRQLLAF